MAVFTHDMKTGNSSAQVRICQPFHVTPFNEHDLLNPRRYLHLGEDLLVVGYSEGERDTTHLHDGTSGSPVLTRPTTIIRYTDGKAELVQDRIKSFKKYLIGVHSEKFDRRYPELDLSFVWFASLIPEVINHEEYPRRLSRNY